MRNLLKVIVLGGFLAATPAWAQQKAADTKSQPQTGNKGAIITKSSTIPPAQPNSEAQNTQIQKQAQPAAEQVNYKQALRANEEIRYTLGPDDIIQVIVQRHPEFSGTFPVNLEGKIQMGFVGDIDVTGYTKKELEVKISRLISTYVVNPEVNVTILEYRSKYYLVIGEVNRPGRYFMRSETTTVKDAIVEAGLPMVSAAMRKCRVITPDKNGRVKTRAVDVYAILYGGNLKKNLEMHPGDTLYVPSTIMAKTFRVIAPITDPVTSAAGAQTGANTLRNRPTPSAQ
jgi:polysaccharide biosynthesis/export protein